MCSRAARMKAMRVGLAVAVAALVWAQSGLADKLPGKEVSLPESAIPDPFYGYLIGLLDANVCGVVGADQLSEVLGKHRGKTSIPFERIREIDRGCGSGTGARDVSISFNGALKTPLPYSILGYHPGSVSASPKVNFLEWFIPSQKIAIGGARSIELSQVHVFGIYEGWTIVDIDDWVDRMMGGLLDDTRIVVMVLFKYNEDWHGLAAGYDRRGAGRSGIFNFRTNKILFPTPRDLQPLAPYFRNFVVRTKHLDAPVPPPNKWKPGK
jgi:hypothetical protein